MVTEMTAKRSHSKRGDKRGPARKVTRAKRSLTKREINLEGKDDQEILELRDRVFEEERGGAERKIAISALVAEQNNQERMDLMKAFFKPMREVDRSFAMDEVQKCEVGKKSTVWRQDPPYSALCQKWFSGTHRQSQLHISRSREEAFLDYLVGKGSSLRPFGDLGTMGSLQKTRQSMQSY